MLFFGRFKFKRELLDCNRAGGKTIFCYFIISLACLRMPTRVS
ncbi:hypothetical protein UNSW3_1026 [Campylobacter concisus UNSW3]|uniref:Uncharacterized protein n=1 Tax=Campylobacter concisus UNSW3 TaxID=1242966 RepID=U2EIJ1_9BACT|nr:hypothetical protein UNSW3_1026 [Campylobacter concisus UNSW3]